MVNNEALNIDFGQVDLSPAIIDYDFKNKRPRGGSCRIDFFSHGMISSALEGIEYDSKVYLKKDNIFFEKGIFLLDFAEIMNNPKLFLEMVYDLKFDKIYLENSSQFNITSIASKLENVDVVLMNFGCVK